MSEVRFRLNGQAVRVEVETDRPLLSLLREDLGLTGTHGGCNEGVCGACTVLVDGLCSRACLMVAGQLSDRAVTTVEGYAVDPRLRRVQEAFVRHHAAQCGFCTAGMLAAVADYLETVTPETPIDDASIRAALAGVLCRCTGYQNIVMAVHALLSPELTP